MAGNGGIIGPTKVVNTPTTKCTVVTATGCFTRHNCQVTSARVLTVAGGGGGGAGLGGGGGAGGVLCSPSITIDGNNTPVVIGAGGAGRDGCVPSAGQA